MDTVALWQIGYGVLGGGLTVVIFYGILALKVYRLQFAIVSLRETLLSLRNTEKVQKRWSKQDALEAELFKSLPPEKEIVSRFANDPMNWKP